MREYLLLRKREPGETLLRLRTWDRAIVPEPEPVALVGRPERDRTSQDRWRDSDFRSPRFGMSIVWRSDGWAGSVDTLVRSDRPGMDELLLSVGLRHRGDIVSLSALALSSLSRGDSGDGTDVRPTASCDDSVTGSPPTSPRWSVSAVMSEPTSMAWLGRGTAASISVGGDIRAWSWFGDVRLLERPPALSVAVGARDPPDSDCELGGQVVSRPDESEPDSDTEAEAVSEARTGVDGNSSPEDRSSVSFPFSFLLGEPEGCRL